MMSWKQRIIKLRILCNNNNKHHNNNDKNNTERREFGKY